MNNVINDDDVMLTTDDDEETTTTIDPAESTYPSDEEFDPYDSGLNDFTFEDDNISDTEEL